MKPFLGRYFGFGKGNSEYNRKRRYIYTEARFFGLDFASTNSHEISKILSLMTIIMESEYYKSSIHENTLYNTIKACQNEELRQRVKTYFNKH